jgi:hypothetical protein
MIFFHNGLGPENNASPIKILMWKAPFSICDFPRLKECWIIIPLNFIVAFTSISAHL